MDPVQTTRDMVPVIEIPKRSQLAYGHSPTFETCTVSRTEFSEAISVTNSSYTSSDEEYDDRDAHDQQLDVEVFLMSRRRELHVMFICSILQIIAGATSLLMGIIAAAFFGLANFMAYGMYLVYGAVVLPAVATIIGTVVLKDHAVPLVLLSIASTVFHSVTSVVLSAFLSLYITATSTLLQIMSDSTSALEDGASGPKPWMFNHAYLNSTCVLLGAYCLIHLFSATPSTHFAAKVCPTPPQPRLTQYLHQYVYIRRRDRVDQAVLRGLMRDINGTDGTSEMGFSTAPTSPRLTMDGSTGSIQTSPRLPVVSLSPRLPD